MNDSTMTHNENLPAVSVVVINTRGTKHLKTCLTTLTQTNYPHFEIIVVDCQTPNIDKWIAKHFRNVRVTSFEKDIGSSASHNVGVAKANPRSKYIAFLDNDTTVENEWLKELVKIMENDEKNAVAQAKVLRANGKGQLDHTGLALDALGTWKTSFNMKENALNRVFDIFSAASSACIVRRSVFEEIGGFDEDYFIYDDDTDFCWRTRLLGYHISFVPRARAHHHGQIMRTLEPRRLYHSTKNRIFTMLKNYEHKNLWPRLFAFYILILLSAFALTFLKKRAFMHALLKGLITPIFWFKKFWLKRLKIQLHRRVSDGFLFKKGLLLRDIYPTLSDVKKKAKILFLSNGFREGFKLAKSSQHAKNLCIIVLANLQRSDKNGNRTNGFCDYPCT